MFSSVNCTKTIMVSSANWHHSCLRLLQMKMNYTLNFT